MIYVITSGCSFSMAYDWAMHVNKEIYTDKYRQDHTGRIYWYTHLFSNLQNLYNTDFEFFNLGFDGSGAGWISRSIIHKVTDLLRTGVAPENIIIIPMWSGMYRKEIFIDNDIHSFTTNKNILNCKELWAFQPSAPKEIYIEKVNDTYLKKLDPYYTKTNELTWEEYYISHLKFRDMKYSILNDKENIKKLDYIIDATRPATRLVFEHFSNTSIKEILIENIEHILRLQWFCEAKNIKIVNISFKQIFFNDMNYQPLLKSIDFNNWHFYKNKYGMLEWVKDMCEIRQDYGDETREMFHPNEIEHKQYTENFLLPIIEEICTEIL